MIIMLMIFIWSQFTMNHSTNNDYFHKILLSTFLRGAVLLTVSIFNMYIFFKMVQINCKRF